MLASSNIGLCSTYPMNVVVLLPQW